MLMWRCDSITSEAFWVFVDQMLDGYDGHPCRLGDPWLDRPTDLSAELVDLG